MHKSVLRLISTAAVVALTSLTGCVQPDEFDDTPSGNLEALWTIVDEHYCFLDYKRQTLGVDWDEVHARYRGLINDNANDVGSVHLGFFFTLATEGTVAVRETEKLAGGFVPLASLAASAGQMETWSQIITPELTELWTAGKL